MSGSSKNPPPPGQGPNQGSASQGSDRGSEPGTPSGRGPVVQVGGSGGIGQSNEDLSATMDLPPGGAIIPTMQEASWSKKIDPRLGQLFGKYRVEAIIGKGGMGLVYEGEDTILNRRVAIKFLPESLTQNPKAIERFITEAQVAGRLNHPNVIAIYDIGQEGDHFYIVMELLNPLSAAGFVKERGPMHWSEATKVIADCCSALHAAHQVGLIHRDIKPDNILCSPTGTTKLVDFGLVKDTQFDATSLTQTGVVAGTPLYMSPEQASDGLLDHRSDIYSLGATYFTLLTGRPPYSGDAAPQIMFKHVTAPTPNPRDLVPEVPEACVEVLMRAMHKSPADRFQTAEVMRLALEEAIKDPTQRSYSFLVPHEPSMLNMRARPLRVGIPGSSISSFNNPKTSGSLGPLGVLGPSGRSIGQPLSMMTSGQMLVGPGSLSEPRGTPPGPDVSQQGQPPQTRTTMLVGGALLLALLALVLVSFRILKPPGPETPIAVQRAGLADLGVALPPKPPIKVGVVNSLSGTMAISSRPIVEATLLAIEEINDAGGLLGRRIEPIQGDGKSHNEQFVHETERLIKDEHVVTIFGGWTPSNRRAMKEIVEKHDHLLIFPSRDEGFEDSPNIIYNGSTLSQQVVPAVTWALNKLGSKRLFIIGSDGLLGRMSTELIRDTLQGKGAKIVGEKYVLLSETDFKPAIKKMLSTKADVLFNLVNGDSNVPLFKEMRAAGIDPEKLPTISFSISESELPQLTGVDMVNDYLAWSYFETVDRPQNKLFVERFKKKYGQYRGISDPMEAAYFGVHLWAQAVKAAGSDDVRAIRRAMQSQSYEAPSSLVRIEPSNNHTWKMFRIGKIVSPTRIDVVWSSEGLLPPEPFPNTRTRAQWEQMLEYFHKQWGGSWVNPMQPNLLRHGH